MSASDQKRMDNAIALANEFASQKSPTYEMQSPFSDNKKQENSDSEPESPKLISKLKKSLKRSPKIERKRTFSEEIQNKADMEDSMPPEAQEAYNVLVVRGSLRDEKKERPVVPQRNYSKESPQQREESSTFRFGLKRQESPQRSELKKESLSDVKREISSPLSDFNNVTSPQKVELSRDSPQRSFGGSSSFRNVPLADTEEVELFVDLETKESEVCKPVPKPRVETPPRREAPVPAPKPRPEIQRVEPVPRPQQPPPRVPLNVDHSSDLNESFGSSHSVGSRDSYGKDSKSGSDILRIHEAGDDLLESNSIKSIDTSDSEDLKGKRQSDVLRIDLPDSSEVKKDSSSNNSSSKDLHIEESKTANISTKSSLLFEDDFSEPSPREIMNKLARESRLRRSQDHQRGISLDSSEPPTNRNLREPQGIPGKSASTSNGDEDEVDTNPLRMLRGGAIPTIRGGRVGQGMTSNETPPKLPPRTNPTLKHSMSVDMASRSRQHASRNSYNVVNVPIATTTASAVDNVDDPYNTIDVVSACHSYRRPPALPPRSYSVCDEGHVSNPPLPPRTPLKERPGSLSAINHNGKFNHKIEIPTYSSAFLSSTSIPGVVDSTDVVASSNCNNSNACDWSPALPSRCGRVSDLPQAPPPPLPPTKLSSRVNNNNNDLSTSSSCSSDDDEDDDNVFNQQIDDKLASKSLTNFNNNSKVSGSSTFPRVTTKFRVNTNVKCNLEQLGYYNKKDPFWIKSLCLAGGSFSDRGSSEEMSPLMLANYKSSDGVSYEDLLDFALDRYGNLYVCPHVWQPSNPSNTTCI